MKAKKCNKLHEYKKTKQGLCDSIYYIQTSNCRKRNYNQPEYSREEITKWLLNQNLFHRLFKTWEESGYKKLLIPSIDRKDDYKSYTFDNIQLMTWGENKLKGFNDKINGINTKQCKAVLQFDLEDNFIKEYYSIRQAGRDTGVHQSTISANCINRLSHAGNYIWKHKE